MPTIYELSMKVYSDYAQRTDNIERLNKEIHLQEADAIPGKIRVEMLEGKWPNIDRLLGVSSTCTPWAFFYAPQDWLAQRRSPFTFGQIAPSLRIYAQEDEETEEEKLEKISVSSKEEEEEKAMIKNCLAQVKKVNSWLSFVVGRMGQFLQG